MAVELTQMELSAPDLRREAARVKEARAARRMLALAHVLDGRTRTEAAQSCGMDRQTLRDQVHRSNAEGVSGLVDGRLAGRPARLSAEQMSELAVVVETGSDPETDGVVRLSARPSHSQGDTEAQAVIKKLFRAGARGLA